MQVAVGYRQRNDGFGLLPNNDLRDFESHNRAVPVRLPQHGQAEGHEMFTGVRGIDSFAHDFLQSKERRLFAAALVDSGIVNTIVKLSKDALHFFGDGQPEVSRILQQGYTLI